MMLTGFSIFLSASTAFTAFVLTRLIQQSNRIKGSPEISSSLPGQLISESLLRTASISKFSPISGLSGSIALLGLSGNMSLLGLSGSMSLLGLKSEKTVSETAMAKAQFFA